LKIRVVNTADYHFIQSAEIDEAPDFINTFPPHCLAGTKGAEYIQETAPDHPLIFDWDSKYDRLTLKVDVPQYRNFVIRKDVFDVFTGNNMTIPLIETLQPEIVVVYGVFTNVCVDYAVEGLAKKVKQLFVLSDAIKELPGIPLPYEKWQKLDVQLVHSKTLFYAFKK
jgi:nicotinamidase/pyrazinamidase